VADPVLSADQILDPVIDRGERRFEVDLVNNVEKPWLRRNLSEGETATQRGTRRCSGASAHDLVHRVGRGADSLSAVLMRPKVDAGIKRRRSVT
jgi:hypothetical protein